MSSLSFSDPRRVPPLPLRPPWLAEYATNCEARIFESARHLMDTWITWADSVEEIFQQMGDQIKDLEISDDTYISFVGMFASHPARPTGPLLEMKTEHEDRLMRTMPYKYLTHLHSLWTAYADEIELTYIKIAAELGRCDLRASPFEPASTRGQLHNILRSMLGPGKSFQGFADARTTEATAVTERGPYGSSIAYMDQIVSGTEHMSLCDAPVIHGEGVRELAVRLKKMNIEPGTSRVD